jgi:signal transduction histidine kinase
VKALQQWRKPYVGHAIRVAAAATVIIAAMYVCVVAGFDLVERHHLVGQIDTRLQQRLAQAVRQPAAAGSVGDYDNAHDVDDAPVFFWRVTPAGSSNALTTGAPVLPATAWSPSKPSVDAQLGTGSFRLQSERVGDDWIVAAQSLASADRIESELLLLEAIAGPVLLVAVFFGTLLVGVKAASPVELARRRQLEFTADASHELRTPLSVIEAEVTLSLTGPRSDDDYRATLGRVGQESMRLREIVEDLLWLARFDSEPLPPAEEPVDVAAIAAACGDRFLVVAQGNGIALSVRDQGQARPWINAPPEWIDRLTAVLVDNACRYAGRGGAVRIGVTGSASRVSLSVDDSGPGIAPEDRSKLFHRFHRATDQGNGAGLGLAIADSVVRATGGEWCVGQADLGGAHMEVSWRRSPGARGPGDLSEPLERSVLDRASEGNVDRRLNVANEVHQTT